MDKKNLIKDIYTLSPMQEGILFHSLLDEESNAYFVQSIIEVRGEINLEIFEKAFNILIARYDIFRTNFIHQKVKKPVQVVLKEKKVDISIFDISNMDEGKKEEKIRELIESDKKRNFNLKSDVLIRASVVKITKERYKIIWSFHHIIMDGWCNSIVVKEFLEIYQSLKDGKSPKEKIIYPYIDYIKWLNKQDRERAKFYWQKYVKDYKQIASLPKGNTDNSEKYIQEERTFIFNESSTKKLMDISKSHNVTLNSIFQTLWGLLLQKYNNTNDVIFGAVVSGRNAEIVGIENMVGLFINTIPVRIHSDDEMTFQELMKKVQYSALESEKFSYFSLSEIQSNSNLKQNLMDHIVIFQNTPNQSRERKVKEENRLGFVIEGIEEFEQTNYDFNVTVGIGPELTVELSYNSMVYDTELINRVEQHLRAILNQVISNINIRIKDIEIISEKERNCILREFNKFEIKHSSKMIHQLFEEAVEKYSNNIALVYDNQKLTYEQLNSKSNRLARTLRKKGVQRDNIVGIATESSLEMIIGILAILKAGGAYLPMDPEYPIDRKNHMLQDSSAQIVLTQSHLSDKIQFDGELVDLNEESNYAIEDDNLGIVGSSSDLAYIIYTSGSTGKPKGVMVEHKNVVSYVGAFMEEFKLSKDDTILQQATYCFDTFIEEVFPMMSVGGKIVIGKKYDVLDIEKLRKIVEKNHINIISCSPLFLNELNKYERMSDIKIYISGGDILKKEYFDSLIKCAKVYNTYGPTETTVCATYHQCNIDEISLNIPIGRSISNCKVYILDKYMSLVPIGISGEMYIAGSGVARGYLNREDLTSEKFVDNPFSNDGKMYKTGDMAEWLPDGNIKFLGRIDNQVKIRGYRIELEEIESQIIKYEGINQAIAVILEGDRKEDKHICAYVVSDKVIDIQELRKYFTDKLPKYMIPSYLTQLKKIPITTNGKIDRNILARVDKNIFCSNQYVKPNNEIEKKLVQIWAGIIKVDNIGIKENFFEIGGNSINAIILVEMIEKELNIKLPLIDIFENLTIELLAKKIMYYSSNGVLNTITRLNNEKESKLFAFPPLSGLGVAFKELAKLIDSYTVFGLDFIEDENRINEYVNLITDIQKEGPYFLMGYSVGGKLALEVAKKMEKEGYDISDIILVDCVVEEKNQDIHDEKKIIDDIVQNVKNSILEMNPLVWQLLGKKIEKKVRTYLRYSNQLIDKEKINGNIHQILSAENLDEQIQRQKKKWGEFTTQSFNIYDGFGEHEKMITDKMIMPQNAEIINSILNSLD